MYSKNLIDDIINWDCSYMPIRYHSGRTDSSFGHRDLFNRSGLGAYHCHNRRTPHLHDNGRCPFIRYEPPCKFSLNLIRNYNMEKVFKNK